MKFKLILTLTMAVLTAVACSSPKQDPAAVSAPSDSTQSRTEYTCPMHPSVISDRPGTCPECKMELQVKS